MSRPLLITDCDEVLLHMLTHFADWLDEAHGVTFTLGREDFHNSVTYKASGERVPAETLWPLLDGFFESEMHRQNIVPGAVEALRRIGEVADIVVLTNIGHEFEAGRVEQLGAFDIRHRVICNRGGKGPPVGDLVAQFGPSVAVFVDDLPQHHESVAEHANEVWRLHMIAEPRIAAHVPPAPRAHARIDDWDTACEWILARFQEGPAS